MKVYHGTSFENAKSIMQHGWRPEQSNWYCSMPNCVYCYRPTSDEQSEYAQQCAIGNAQIAAALSHSQSTSVGIIEVDISDEMIEEIEDFADQSCEGMQNALEFSVEMVEKFPKRMIEVCNKFIPSLGLLYLSYVCPDEEGWLNTDSLSETELELLMNFDFMQSLADAQTMLLEM